MTTLSPIDTGRNGRLVYDRDDLAHADRAVVEALDAAADAAAGWSTTVQGLRFGGRPDPPSVTIRTDDLDLRRIVRRVYLGGCGNDHNPAWWPDSTALWPELVGRGFDFGGVDAFGSMTVGHYANDVICFRFDRFDDRRLRHEYAHALTDHLARLAMAVRVDVPGYSEHGKVWRSVATHIGLADHVAAIVQHNRWVRSGVWEP